MNNQDIKTSKLIDILNSPWSTNEITDNMVTVTGAIKTNTVELEQSELPILLSLLQNESQKVILGAIELIGLFGKKAKSAVSKLGKLYTEFDQQQRLESLKTLHRIKTKEVIKEYEKIVAIENEYDILFDLIFYLSDFVEEYPNEVMSVIAIFSEKEEIWDVIKRKLESSILKDQKQKIAMIKDELLVPEKPLIGISQEAEQKRLQLNLTLSNLEKGILKLKELSTAGNREAAKTLKSIKKHI